MTKPTTHFDRLLETLELAYSHIGWCWDRIETNTIMRREGSGDILLKIEAAIAEAKKDNSFDWLAADNLDALRATGNLSVQIDDGALLPLEEAIAEAKRLDEQDHKNHSAAVIPNVVIQDNRVAPPLREYDITWRRRCDEYAHDTISALSIADAMAQAQARAGSRYEDGLRFETNSDSADAVDWINVEGDNEHTEWEEPLPPGKGGLSPGALVEALNKIVSLANATTSDKSNAMVLGRIFAIAHEALTKAVPS